jgi:hypothetical protein
LGLALIPLAIPRATPNKFSQQNVQLAALGSAAISSSGELDA